MIDLFIVHSGEDYEYVLNTVIPTLVNTEGDKKGHANVLLLSSDQNKNKNSSEFEKINNPDNFEICYTGQNWKKIAKKCIKRARVVLVIAGNDIEKKKETMGFEISYACKCGKLILMHKTSPDVKLPDFLTEKDKFTGKIREIAYNQPLEQIRKRIDDFDIGYYNIFNDDIYEPGSHDKEYIGRIMEQYKIYQKTSEDLVERRQNVNSFYITVNSAIVAVFGVILGLADYPSNTFVIIIMAVIGIILDISWIKLLEAYGVLNSAKMKVICMLERELPIRLYDTEWMVMSDKLNLKKYVSFTDSEKRIPKILIGVYSFIIIADVLFTILH